MSRKKLIPAKLVRRALRYITHCITSRIYDDIAINLFYPEENRGEAFIIDMVEITIISAILEGLEGDDIVKYVEEKIPEYFSAEEGVLYDRLVKENKDGHNV